MPDLVVLIIYSLVAGVVGTGLGGVIGILFKKDSNRTMSLLLSLAGGIMLSVVCFDLIPEGISAIEGNKSILNNIIVISSAIIGIAVIFALNYFIDKYTERRSLHLDKEHPKTHDDIDELIHSEQYTEAIVAKKSKTALLKAGIIMLIAIALHNFPEGLSIGSSISLSLTSGILLSILIALHNIPEGMAIVVPLYSGGMKKGKAVLLTALSGFPTVLGAIIGYLIGGSGQVGLAIAMGLASGAMIYVIFCEILPQSTLMYKSKLPAFFTIIGLLFGKILMELIEFISSLI